MKFPKLTDQCFEELWKELKDSSQKLNVDLMTAKSLIEKYKSNREEWTNPALKGDN